LKRYLDALLPTFFTPSRISGIENSGVTFARSPFAFPTIQTTACPARHSDPRARPFFKSLPSKSVMALLSRCRLGLFCAPRRAVLLALDFRVAAEQIIVGIF